VPPRRAQATHGHGVRGTIVVSFFARPGRLVRYFSADGTIWSIDNPSSRVQDTFAIGTAAVWIGLAVSNRDTTRRATARFEGVGVRLP
jgi:hypothetical protein